MRGKARRDSSVFVLLAPPVEYDSMMRQLVPEEDFQIPVEKTVATTVQSKFHNNTRSLPSSYFKLFLYTVHVPLADAE